MGNIVPDRLFWAQPGADDDDAAADEIDAVASDAFVLPPHETKH
jgi:hydroxymethylpyrimidine/phosphomethylpyrimidine kinase